MCRCGCPHCALHQYCTTRLTEESAGAPGALLRPRTDHMRQRRAVAPLRAEATSLMVWPIAFTANRARTPNRRGASPRPSRPCQCPSPLAGSVGRHLTPSGARRRAAAQGRAEPAQGDAADVRENASEACGGAGDGAGGGNAIAAGRRRLTVVPTAVVDGLSISSWACFGRVSGQGPQGRPA